MTAAALLADKTIEELSDTVMRLAAEVRRIKELDSRARYPDGALTRLARRLYEGHRARDRCLHGVSLPVGDPVWDMLLDLFLADSADSALSTTSVVIGAYCAPTTGLRYVEVLVRSGFVTSDVDPTDRRRRMLRLTSIGRERVHACLHAILEAEGRQG